MSPPPLFTIIVPTRDRAATLPHSVASVLEQRFADLELIVVDNCSHPAAAETLSGLTDPRLQVLRAPQRLAMHDNWEFGLAHARGRYIMVIGDDDAVMPDGMELASRILRDKPADVLAWPRHDFKWPDSTLFPGLMVVRLGDRVGDYDGHRHLAGLFSWRGPSRFVPSIYHSLVSADLVARVRQAQGGRYFADPVCDIESEMLNAFYAHHILACERPLTMNGHSGASNGGSNGEAAAIQAAHRRFAAEAGMAEPDLVPYGWDFPLYMPTMIAGCQARVKARHFPMDDRFSTDIPALLQHLASTYFVFGPEAFDGLTERLRRIAQASGVDPAGVTLPPPDRRKVEMNFATGIRAGEDGAHSVVIDSRKAGLDTIGDAVRLADAIMPAIPDLPAGKQPA